MERENTTIQGETLQIDSLHAIEERERFERLEMEGVRDPVTQRLVQHATFGADDQLQVTFFTNKVYSRHLTNKANDGIKRFVECEFVKIEVPLEPHRAVTQMVEEFHKWRFPKEYEAFKLGYSTGVTGTPLTEWSGITEEDLAELHRLHLTTVEQLANMSDGASSSMLGFFSKRDKARAFLAARDKGSVVEGLKQRDEKIAGMSSELEAMKEQIAALLAAQGKKKGD